MPIQIKLGRKTIDIDYDDLKAMISRGEIGPSVLIKGHILTDDEWRTIDNLRIYHRYSPEAHPLGEKLQDKREFEQRMSISSTIQGALCSSYLQGNLIEASYYLSSLEGIVRDQKALGASRLLYITSSEPEKILTFVFKQDVVRIDAVMGVVQLRSSFRRLIYWALNTVGTNEMTITPFQYDQQIRKSHSIKTKNLPKPIHSWGDLVTHSLEAGECADALRVDGGGVSEAFRHKVVDDEISIDVEWVCPMPHKDAAQLEIVQWYRDCSKRVGLEEFWEHTHYEQRREERKQKFLRFRDWARENYPDLASRAVDDNGFVISDSEDPKIYRRLFDEWETEVKES